ncbi:cadherin-like domain-containing protein [Nitrosomonas sp. Nm34]|uniref:cadherin-like domain-containing protein n=1 Tax=Nitrosomonas sp. Nm34 TaxID=1881055 RepID=UPI0008E0E4CA|nr:cadherin-like domain-containing protein [Nitrosomonas sp. Nm34]SFI20465.1 hypothetical protein SAMN05428978_10023 [Nitrosomonas sp. Nm34]
MNLSARFTQYFMRGCLFFALVSSLWLTNIVHAQNTIAPKNIAIYYGMPSLVNGANGNVSTAVDVFNDYDAVVFGDSLQFPQYTGAFGQIPYFGCDQNSHFDHDLTQQIIKQLQPPSGKTQVYGYVSIGGENTARQCNGIPVPLTVDEMKERIDAWANMGVVGIFLDEAEYGFGSTRTVQNEIVDYVHSKSLKAFINGYNPDDVFGTDIINEISYTTGYYANTLSSVQMNPQGVAPRLGAMDIYLLEHYQVINGSFVEPQIWIDRSDKAHTYKQKYGTQIATITTQADVFPNKTDCTLLFEENKFDYAWWSTLLYGFDFMAWGEPSGFSSWGTCSNALPFHARPNLGDIGEFISSVMHPLPNAQPPIHYRNTTTGVIEVDTSAHTGRFSPATSPNQAPIANDDNVTTFEGRPIIITALELLKNDSDPDNDGINVATVDTTSSRGGTIFNNGDNTYTYKPAPNILGTDSFNYTIVDDRNMGAKAVVYVNITHPMLTPATYFPETVTVSAGEYQWGTLKSFKQADKDTYDIKSRQTADGRSTDWYATTTIQDWPASMSELSLSYKGQYSRKNVMQSLYLYNYKTANWDLLDKRAVGNTDDVTVSAVINLSPDKYVSSKGEMKVRVRGIHTNRNFECWANSLSWTVR